MTPQRSAIKIYFAGESALDPAKMVPLFHEWIRGRSVEGLLVDVADYRHVHEGPAVIVVGHEVDYSIDLSEGRAGLQATLKRPASGDLAQDLRQGLRRLVAAARTLQHKADPHPPVRFRTDEFRVQVIDRLRFPNAPETVAGIRRAVESALRPVFEGGRFSVVDGAADARAPLTLRILAPEAPGLDTLLSRLTAPV